jgi:hypothetical protein
MRVCFVATTLLLASTLSVVSALQVIVTGFNIFSATYAPTDKSCTGIPISVTYIALGVCYQSYALSFVLGFSVAPYVIASADAAGNIYLSPYSDAACTVSTGADTKASSQRCVNGISTNQYAVLAPDATLNVQPVGTLIAINIAYAASDTSCSKTPVQAEYLTAQQCVPPVGPTNAPIPIESSQLIVDGSSNVYVQTFTGTTTCAAGVGPVTVELQPTQKCGPGRASWFIVGAFPAALVPQITQVFM